MNKVLLENLQLNIVQEKNLREMDINIGHRGYYALKNLMKSLKISLLGGKS